jgi:hypothetical protein
MKHLYSIRTSMHTKSEKGVILYLALIGLGAVLAIVLGIGALIVGQIKLVGGIGNAVVAFYAAEAGIERAAFENYVIGAIVPQGSLTNNATYDISILDPSDPACNGTVRCIKSVGKFGGTSRAVDVSLGN